MATTNAGMADGLGILITFVILCLISLPMIIMAIVSLIIGNQHLNVSCDDLSFWSLPSWLISTNIVLLIYFIGGLVLYFVVFCMLRKREYKFIISFVLLNGLITFIFNLVGCIIMFYYANNCINEVPDLWKVSLASLIFQWIYIFLSICILVYVLYICCKHTTCEY
jgi:hypothetical protein